MKSTLSVILKLFLGLEIYDKQYLWAYGNLVSFCFSKNLKNQKEFYKSQALFFKLYFVLFIYKKSDAFDDVYLTWSKSKNSSSPQKSWFLVSDK